MTDLLKLTPLVRTIAVLLGLVGLLSQSLLMYFLQPLPRFQSRNRKLLEGMILVLLVLLEGVLIEKSGWICRQGQIQREIFFSWSLEVFFLVLALRRALDLLPETIREKREQITEYSIQESLDSLEEGVLITLQNGEPVLMNRALFRYTESILGTGVRNGNVLWHLLQEVRRPGLYRENQGRGLLFHLPDGRWLLCQRDTVLFAQQTHWQLTISDVTELQQLNQSLDAQNRQLQQKNTELKKMLQHVQEIQSRETLREIRTRIHDLMGMRISLLQQVLNNREFADYQRIMPLLATMLSDVRQEIRVDPQVRLGELVSLYRKLGVLVTVRGTLPKADWKEELYVQIIREALTNAICHGRASQVTLVLGENSLLIQDNGLGCTGPVLEGGGLGGIREKVESRGGTLVISGTPHFMLKIRLLAEKKEGKDHDPNSAGG